MADFEPTQHLSYLERNAFLKTYGYQTYGDYLASDLWKGVQARVKASKGGKRCYICRKKAFAVHHERYTPENLLGHSLDYLRPICDGCHKEIEFRNGAKIMCMDEVAHRAELRKAAIIAESRPEPRRKNLHPSLKGIKGSRQVALIMGEKEAMVLEGIHTTSLRRGRKVKFQGEWWGSLREADWTTKAFPSLTHDELWTIIKPLRERGLVTGRISPAGVIYLRVVYEELDRILNQPGGSK